MRVFLFYCHNKSVINIKNALYLHYCFRNIFFVTIHFAWCRVCLCYFKEVQKFGVYQKNSKGFGGSLWVFRRWLDYFGIKVSYV